MALKIEVHGHRKLFDLADVLREAGRKDLDRALARGARVAAREVGDEIRSSTDTYIPRGFEATFAASLEIKYQARLAHGRRVSVIVFATGAKGNRRDIEGIAAGRLRHPVYGRRRRVRRHWIYKGHTVDNPWVVQQIRSGLVSEPARRAIPRAVKKIDEAVAAIAAKIERSV